MSRKRIALLALFAAAALAAAGIATAGRSRGPSVQAAAATFSATVARSHEATCSIDAGDTYKVTVATYTGTASSSDPRLDGALTIRARSLVDTTTGLGHVYGVFRIRATGGRSHGVINAALSNGNAVGLARGVVRHPSGRLVASLGASFDPATGFGSGSIGGSGNLDAAGVIRSGPWCSSVHLHHK
jgi:hypothetical protein